MVVTYKYSNLKKIGINSLAFFSLHSFGILEIQVKE